MDRKKAIDFICDKLIQNEKIKDKEKQFTRRDIVDILMKDFNVPESTAYGYYKAAIVEYEWEQLKKGTVEDSVRSMQLKSLKRVWDAIQGAEDEHEAVKYCEIYSRMSTRYKIN